MTNEERDIQRKLRVLRHAAEKIGNARKACHWKNGLKPSAQKD